MAQWMNKFWPKQYPNSAHQLPAITLERNFNKHYNDVVVFVKTAIAQQKSVDMLVGLNFTDCDEDAGCSKQVFISGQDILKKMQAAQYTQTMTLHNTLMNLYRSIREMFESVGLKPFAIASLAEVEVPERKGASQIADQQKEKELSEEQGMTTEYRKTISALTDQNDLLGNELIKLEKELEDQRQKMKELTEKNETLQKTEHSIANKESEEHLLDNELIELKKELEDQRQRIKELTEENETLQKKAEYSIAHKESEENSLDSELIQLKEELEDQRKIIKKLTKKNETLQKKTEQPIAHKESATVLLFPSGGKAIKKVEEELRKALKIRLNNIAFTTCSKDTDIDSSKKLIVLRIITSSVSEDAAKAIENIKNPANTALLLVHTREGRAWSKKGIGILTDDMFNALGGIFDLQFEFGEGIIKCEMNDNALKEICAYIEEINPKPLPIEK